MSSAEAVTQSFAIVIEDLGHEVHLRSFSGEEGICKLFRFRLVVDIKPSASAQELLGRDAVFTIEGTAGRQRTFFGTICGVEELGSDEYGCATYELDLAPRLWPLVHTVQSRVFEDLDALSIIVEVFAGSGIQVISDTTTIGRPRPYCVQYFESDFDFVVRLIEEEGYVYQCGHNKDNEPTFEIRRVPSSCPAVGSLTFEEGHGGHHERITSWRRIRSVAATTLTGHDHQFQLNPPVLEAVASIPSSNPAIPGWEPLDSGWAAPVDHFPAQWAHHFEQVSRSLSVAAPTGYKEFCDKRAWVELRQAVGSNSMNAGASSSPRLAPGSVFELENHSQSNGKHLVVSMRHKGAQPVQHSSKRGDAFEYENQFTCVPFAETMMYLPPRATRKPVIHGCQTAIVVGSSGSDEIFTDMYGRVQVRFWWDRENARSCWVRVATSWAGSNWGVQYVPRVGQEVVVTFLDGDPDRPLIVGSVYNPSNMPPFSLPEHKTQSGIRTQSTSDAEPGASNEIRFEDAKDKEEIYIHAQRDRTEKVEHDARQKVGNDSRSQVNGHRLDLVVKNFHTKTGGEKREAVVGNSSLTVAGDYTIAVAGQKDQPGTGGHLAVAARDKIHLKASSIVIEADNISLRTTESGREFIHLEKGSGITIDSKGDRVWINTGGAGSPEDGCFKEPVAQPDEPFPPPPKPAPKPFPFNPPFPNPFPNPFPKPGPKPWPKPLPHNPWDFEK